MSDTLSIFQFWVAMAGTVAFAVTAVLAGLGKPREDDPPAASESPEPSPQPA